MQVTDKSLYKNLIKVLVFVLILFLVLRSLSYILRTNGESKDRFARFYAEKENTIDVFLMGSSTVGSSFAPAYMWGNYGFTSYPLSSNSQRPKAIKYLIEEGLKYQQPKLVVIEMRTFVAEDEDFAQDEGHIREVVDNMKYSWHRKQTIDALTDRLDNKYSFYVDLFKYHSNVGELFSVSELKKYSYSAYDIDKGFSMYNHTENYSPGNPVYDAEGRMPIPESQEEVLKDLIEYLKEKNLAAVFVVTPRDDHNDGYEYKMNYCKDIINKAGYDFIDMNFMYDEMGFDFKYDMDDGAHTNAWGAVKCSTVLGEYIKNKAGLDFTYSDKVIEQWDKAYEAFVTGLNELVPEDKSGWGKPKEKK